MMNFFSERTLPILQTMGMLFLAILTTLGVGSYVIWSFSDHFEDGLRKEEARVIEVQETILDNQLIAVISRLEHGQHRADVLLREQIQEHTAVALSIARSLNTLNQGKLTPAEIESLVVETLRPLRFFNGRGYYFIGTIEDGDAKVVLMPPMPEIEGKFIWEIQDAEGTYTARDLKEAIMNPSEEGFTHSLWYPLRDNMRAKITHVRVFDPFNWIIGSSEYTHKIEEDLKRKALEEIGDIRFPNNGYVLVLRPDGTLLASANNPQLVGVAPSTLPDAFKNITQRLITLAKASGGSIRYDWERLDGERKVRKLVRAAYYKPWDWILLTGIYLDDIDTILDQQRQSMTDHVSEQIRNLVWVMFAVLLVSLAFALGFGRWVRCILDVYRSDLEARSRDLAESRERLKLSAQVFDCSGEGMVVCDADNQILAVNPAFSCITGYQADEVWGQDPKFLKSGLHDTAFFQALWHEVIESGGWSGEIWNRRQNGEIFPAWLSINLVHDEKNRVTNFIGIMTDITRRKKNEEKIRELAFYDPLTQLPNRLLLRDRLDQAIAAANRSKQQGAVLFIDLDNFKTLNDTRGHDIGDLLLIEVAKRLRHCLREQDTVARLGGDEFIVVLVSLSTNEQDAAKQVERIIVKIMTVINESYDLVGTRYHATASIGACLFHWAENSVDILLRHADTAMYQAKQTGRNRFCFFDPAMQKVLMERTRMEDQLRGALDRNEFVCFYQPQVDEEGRITGAEVLLRWYHPSMGMISPRDFIPLAEETGLIVPIGVWVLHQACAKLQAWFLLPSVAHLTLAVNVSAVQFREADFITQVEQVITAHRIAPHSLKLELTESLVLEDVEGTIDTMKHLKSLGVDFSMDDFGTGYSSLAYLKRLPLDELKIDRSFVRDIIIDPNDAVIIRTIIAMAHSMGLDVLAEGVETAEQLDCLIANGCRRFQGYYFGRPMDADMFKVKAELTTNLKAEEE